MRKIVFDIETSVYPFESLPLDTSAAAIVASAAIELYQFTKDEKYLNAAENMLNDLTLPPHLAEGSAYESILTRGSFRFDAREEFGAIFGDFYLVEAMLRYKDRKQGE
jgi:hypothetical protein